MSAPQPPPIPKRIEVVRNGRTATVLVDGQPFPWAIDRRAMEVDIQADAVPTVTLTLLAEQVVVTNAV